MKKILKKIFNNKFILILLSIFLFVGTITFSAFSLSKSSTVTPELFGKEEMHLDIKESGDTEFTTWKFEYRKFSGSVTGEKGACSSSKSHSGTLTLTYEGEDDAIVAFDYKIQLNGGECKINNEQKSDGTGKYESEIKKGDSITFYIKSGEGKITTTIDVSEFKCTLRDANITVTLKKPISGTYTIFYNSETLEINEEREIEVLSGTNITLKANAYEGFSFANWNFNGAFYSSEPEISTTLDIGTTIEAIFYSDSAAIFSNNGYLYYYLDDAIESAEQSNDKIILLNKGGLIEGGTTEKNKIYTIPDGVTLYIPDDNSGDKTMHTDGESVFYETGYVIPKCYIELQIPSYTEIVVESGGFIYVDSTACGQMPYNGAPSKAYGKIHLLNSSSKITINGGGKLYCYGYITGAGLVEALNGSEIYEFFQISDFRGGDTSLSMLNNNEKVFYFNNYYIQNIEARLIMNYGSVEYVSTASYLKKSFVSDLATAKTAFISSTDSDSGLFRLHKNSALEKKYNGDLDRLEIKLLSGEADFSSIALSLTVLFIPLDMNSENFVLPFNNNMTVTICSGSTVNITKDICLLPGTELIVEEGATINVTDGASIYFYDRESWVGKKFCVNNVDFHSVRYAVSKRYNRTSEDLKSAILNNNGTITINTGAGLYTTKSSSDLNYNNIANVFSSNGTGVFQFSGMPGSKTITYQYSGDFVGISVSYLLLRNSMNQSPNASDTTFDLNGVGDLTDKNIYFDLSESQWKLRTFDEKIFEISFVDNTYNNETYKSNFTVGENLVFPTAEQVNFINGIYKVRRWKIEGVGLFNPGDSYVLNEARNLTVIAIYGGWTNNGSDVYYVDYYSDFTPSGLFRAENREDSSKTSIYKFLEGGLLDYSYSGIYFNKIDNYSYYIEGGMVIETEGFLKISSKEELGLFYYIFISSNNALLKNGTFYIDSTNGLLPSGYYTFDENGYIFREDAVTINSKGKVYIKDNKTYIDGIKVSYGLFAYNDGNHYYYYYSNNNGEIVRDQTFFITNVNDTGVKQGLYYFDEQGRMYNQNFELWEVNNA